MLEGDEILETAQETGYRLCIPNGINCEENVLYPKRIFSVSWDVCIARRLMICTTTGELEVHDLNYKTISRYHIKFRRFISAHENSQAEEKVITSHWDKLLTIPGRPHELVFLLGISKTLLYTSLPIEGNNDNKPLLSSYTRPLPGYINGAPVMELCSHIARVTSLATSIPGNLLASGDEAGNVKLFLLQLLDTLTQFRTGKKVSKSKPGHHARHQSFLPSYHITERLHTGPVFSLSWLPIDQPGGRSDQVDDHSYVLVSGSVDHCVRLWRIICSRDVGLSITPFMVLNTLSAQILSLYSYAPDDVRVYLAAGTHLGTVHVWHLPHHTLTSLLLQPSNGDHTQSMKDDGSHLIGLLQPSDQPIIHLSLIQDIITAMPSPPRVLLVISDTKGLLKMYASCWHKASDLAGSLESSAKPNAEEWQRIRRKYAHYLNKNRVMTLLAADEVEYVEGLVPLREEQRDGPIVACAFTQRSDHGQRLGEEELLVAGYPGDIEIYSLRNLTELCQQQDQRLDKEHYHSPRFQLGEGAEAAERGEEGRMSPLKNLYNLHIDTGTASPKHVISTPRTVARDHASSPPASPFKSSSSPSHATSRSQASPMGGQSQAKLRQEQEPVSAPAVTASSPSRQPFVTLDDDDAEEEPRTLPTVVKNSIIKSSTGRNARSSQSQAKKVKLPPSTTSSSSSHVQHVQPKDSDELIPDKDPSPYITGNNMTHPALHSSLVMQTHVQQLSTLAQELEDDNISQNTLLTTQSDRLYALEHSEQMYADAAAPRYAYSALPAVHYVDEQSLQEALKDLQTKPKDVKRRPQASGLSAEELEQLAVPEPHVQLSMLFQEELDPAQTDRKHSIRYKYNHRYGLHVSMRSSSQLPEYRLELNAADIFGDLSQRSYLEQVDGVAQRYAEAFLLSSAPFVSSGSLSWRLG
jgi:hypothetical protein